MNPITTLQPHSALRPPEHRLPTELMLKIFSFLPTDQVELLELPFKDLFTVISLQSQSSPILSTVLLRTIDKDPGRGIRQYLASSYGEQPSRSIQKLIIQPETQAPLFDYCSNVRSLQFSDRFRGSKYVSSLDLVPFLQAMQKQPLQALDVMSVGPLEEEELTCMAQIRTLKKLSMIWNRTLELPENFSLLDGCQLEILDLESNFEDDIDLPIPNKTHFWEAVIKHPLRELDLERLGVIEKEDLGFIGKIKTLKKLTMYWNPSLKPEDFFALSGLQLEVLRLPYWDESGEFAAPEDEAITEKLQFIAFMPLKEFAIGAKCRNDTLQLFPKSLRKLSFWVSKDIHQEEALLCLAGLSKLEELSLPIGLNSDAMPKKLAALPLKKLHLEGNHLSPSITDAGLALLSEWTRLESLTLHGDHFSNRGLASLKNLSALKHLNLAASDRVTGAMFPFLPKTLESLVIYGSERIDPEHFQGLKHLQRLKILQFPLHGLITKEDIRSNQEEHAQELGNFHQPILLMSRTVERRLTAQESQGIDALLVTLPSLERLALDGYWYYLKKCGSRVPQEARERYTRNYQPYDPHSCHIPLDSISIALRRAELQQAALTAQAAQAASLGPDAIVEPPAKSQRTTS